MIRLQNVSFSYTQTSMLFNLEVRAGEFMGIVGPSGAGKSTLLSLIAGFERPDSGHIFLAGENMEGLAPALRPCSLLFQSHNDFPHLTLWQNVALGISPTLRLTVDQISSVNEALARVGLADFRERYPIALSGGERQRIGIARALVRQQPLLLLDEPFTALGPALREQMLHLLRELQLERKLTVLMVTHQPEDIAPIADRIAFVVAGEVAFIMPTLDFFSLNAPSIIQQYLKS